MTAASTPKSLKDNPILARWISFELPGKVLIRPGKVELGQGILTALAQIVAEELDLSLGQIEVCSADTAVSPDEGITAGSQSIEVSGASLRLVAAHARAELFQTASRRLQAAPEILSCRDGVFFRGVEPVGLDFWTVAADVDWTKAVEGPIAVRAAADYAIVGTSPPRLDLAVKISRGGYIHDIALENMLHARVVRQPFRLARLTNTDTAWLSKHYPGVELLCRQDFVALVGPDEFDVQSAQADADAFLTWSEEPGRWQPAETAGEMRAVIRDGEVPLSMTNLALRARYSRGYVAHGSIAPSCGLAFYEHGQLSVWTHSQGIFALRDQIAACLGFDVANVRVVHAHGAGCYGHNSADDAALDAAIIAVDHAGIPVRVQWSRQDELSRAPLGAAMSAEIGAALDAAGSISAWRMSVVSAPHAQRPGFGGHVNLTSAEALDVRRLPGRVEDLPDVAGGGASRNAVAIYDFPSHEVCVALDTSSSVRTSSLRSLGAHLNVFAIESAMDELAEIAAADPLEFRLRHLRDQRCRAVLEGAAKMSGWPGSRLAGEGQALGIGVARYKNKGAWLAAVAEVTVDEAVRVERLWLCVDAGLLINPEGARNQIEGGAIQAISWTLKEAISLENDRVPALDWQSYPILRFSDVPQIETRFIVDRGSPPLGAGEASQGPVAAAIGNAASRALGVRLRDLPLTRERLIQILTDS
ncbi:MULTISPECIES: molybdopterin cofactor-binding domain-containing protein [unclassified Ensifer]|uniref:xanthine dehydrogenase family protein molybdopterin-binding subunit n=1 Tax=unclassified Ensifer TaxID=2633371 RepID=UPI00081372D9|nr:MULTISPECIES: molybdopterin cofactor-binding domain-containing protein [unclassified Ensifer]OCP20920.1 hypothetical protein BC361_28035 [Ensifer sp. LC54]OCP25475.1 hypothetical protein BC363_19890 [Ensifer sp. LC384]